MHRSLFTGLIALILALAAAELMAGDDLAPSKMTGAEILPVVKRATDTDELHAKLNTTPAMVSSGRFHWVLKDGSLWTDFIEHASGRLLIARWIIESEPVNESGGRAVELNSLVSHYYAKPRPDRIAAAMTTISDFGLAEVPHVIGPMKWFFAYVFKAHPDRIEAWA